MKQGFIKVAAMTPAVRVADPTYNKEQILKGLDEAEGQGAKVIVFPELCLSGSTCGDLFYQQLLLKRCGEALLEIAKYTERKGYLAFVGLPVLANGKCYNVTAAICAGSVLGLVPKTCLTDHGGSFESRYFTPGQEQPIPVLLDDDTMVPMGTRLLFGCRQMPELKIGVEIGEDLWSPNPPGTDHAMAGATLIVNSAAVAEMVGQDSYRRELVRGQSARLIAGYIYAGAGDGESTQDKIYAGHNLIAENGVLLAESGIFRNGNAYSEIDVQRLCGERQNRTSYLMGDKAYITVDFSIDEGRTELTRFVSPKPFVPTDGQEVAKRCDEIFMMQILGLKKRLEYAGCRMAVVSVSGSLQSLWTLLVAVKTFDMLGLDRSGVVAVTVPGFDEADPRYEAVVEVLKALHVKCENGQLREYHAFLVDIAGKMDGIILGCSDMTDLAMGRIRQGGEFLAMYSVNASVPKTMLGQLMQFYAGHCSDFTLREKLAGFLYVWNAKEKQDRGNAPVSAPDAELEDFLLYYVLRCAFAPKKIYRLAESAFRGKYTDEQLKKAMEIFYKRFFAQQSKRSRLPDGVTVGSVSLSPRGNLRMPSDAAADLWLDELGRLDEDEWGATPDADFFKMDFEEYMASLQK